MCLVLVAVKIITKCRHNNTRRYYLLFNMVYCIYIYRDKHHILFIVRASFLRNKFISKTAICRGKINCFPLDTISLSNNDVHKSGIAG
jgi:hypothetical protein